MHVLDEPERLAVGLVVVEGWFGDDLVGLFGGDEEDAPRGAARQDNTRLRRMKDYGSSPPLRFPTIQPARKTRATIMKLQGPIPFLT